MNVQRKKLCSECEGDDVHSFTKYYRSLNSDEICVIENNKCVMKYSSKVILTIINFAQNIKEQIKNFVRQFKHILL